MFFKDLIKRLWKNKIVNTNALSSLNDCIPIPTREVFEGNQEKLKFLEDVKKEYSDILSKKKTVLSIDLNIRNLYEQMSMYIELLYDLLESEEVDNLFEKAIYNDGTKKMSIMIKMSKLRLYNYRIEKLAFEANVRRMALKEILEEKVFLSSKKINSIKEEMNHLAGTLLMYANQNQTIKLQTETYLNKHENLGNEEFVEKEIETELLNAKYEELQCVIKELMPRNKEFQNKSENMILDITFMEEMISKYIYKHKEEVKKVKEEIALLEAKMKAVWNPEQFLSQIERLEMRIKAFTLYGHNLIKKENLCQLYNIKFIAITDNIMAKEEQHIADKCSFVELECYGEIIMSKISELVQGNVPFLKEKFSTNYSIILRAVKQVLKNEQNIFDFFDILNDKKKIGLLLAFEKNNGLEDYFRMRMEPKEKYKSVDFHENIFKFEYILPLDTIYSMMYYNKQKSSEPLYKVYKIFKKEQEKNHKFDFPMGLTKIDIPSEDLLESENKFIEKIRELCHYKDIEFPTSLRELSGPLLSMGEWHIYEVGYIKLNEGIRKISNRAFVRIKANSIIFPSSIENIEQGVFASASIKNIQFNNYKELRLNKESLRYLVYYFFEIRKIGESYKYFDPLGKPTKCVIPKFRCISFLDDKGFIININGTELKKKVHRSEVFSSLGLLSTDKIDEILNDIKEKIADKEKILEKKGGKRI